MLILTRGDGLRKMSNPTTNKRLEELELELKELRRELQVLRDRVDGLATHHDMFGPIKTKEEPWCPF